MESCDSREHAVSSNFMDKSPVWKSKETVSFHQLICLKPEMLGQCVFSLHTNLNSQRCVDTIMENF